MEDQLMIFPCVRRVEHLAIGTSGFPTMDDIQPIYATVPLPTFQPADIVIDSDGRTDVPLHYRSPTALGTPGRTCRSVHRETERVSEGPVGRNRLLMSKTEWWSHV
jgi:hypothetical protein